MKQYNQLSLSFAKRIITLANKKHSRYEIEKETGISKGKIKRCLESLRQKRTNKIHQEEFTLI